MTTRTIVATAILAFVSQGVMGQPSAPETGKLFAGCRYHYRLNKSTVTFDVLEWWAKVTTNVSEEVIYRGTFMAVSGPSGRVYVTAAHVLGINLKIASVDGHEIDGKTATIMGRETRAYMGSLGYEIGRVGQVDSLSDVAFVEPRKDQIANGITCMSLATNAPRADEMVRIIGHPGTAHQQIETAVVTAVIEGKRYFVLNRPVEPGFSGGPVVNAENQVYGVIVSTDQDNKQTTVMRLKDEDLSAIQWRRIEDLPYP